MNTFLQHLENQGLGMQIMDIPNLHKNKSKKEVLKHTTKMCKQYFGKKPTIEGYYRECENCRKSTLRPVSINYVEEYMTMNNNEKIEYQKRYPERFAKPVKFLRCGRCKLAYYCDRNCQIKNWKKHKNWCNEERRKRIKKIFI
jgi:hypothetical protein